MEYDAGPENTLTEGSMRAVELGGQKLLLARVEGTCHAIGNTCPHAGGPLNEGVLHGRAVICPWHKATFDLTTGKRLEPPALDDVPRYDVHATNGRLMVTIGEESERISTDPAHDDVGDQRCMVIVGAGAAGAAAAQALREQEFGGRIVMIGQEDRLPYDRTVLSKYALSGKQGGEKTPLQDQAFYDRHAIERMTRRVSRVDTAARTVVFGDGGTPTLAYDALLVATGGTPRKLGVPGEDLAGVHLLRSAADAEAIAAAAESARSVVVAGAGFIAMEAAASLRERGLAVTVVAPQASPFERQLGREVGDAFRRVHERQGVVFRLGEEVAAFEGDQRVSRVRLKSGGTLDSDLVVVGSGISPATDILQGMNLRRDGGVEVDARLRAADGVYAAGDIAAFPQRGDGAPIRVEHWRVAEQHGRVAAANMLGGAVTYDAVPYFWTIHFMKRLDYVGHAEEWDEVVIDGDLDTPEFTAFYVKDGRVDALAAWGRDKQAAAAIGLMTDRREWSLEDLKKAVLF